MNIAHMPASEPAPDPDLDERLAEALGPVLAADRSPVLADLVAGALGRGETEDAVERALHRWRDPYGMALGGELIGEALRRGAFWYRLRPGLDDRPRMVPGRAPGPFDAVVR